jgi:hypothetical protein
METLSKNNHYFDIKNCNEFFKIYLIKRKKYRLIIKRRLFKFRRKINQSNQFNNNHINLQDIPRISIQQILNRQWIQTFKQEKSNKIEIPLMNNAIDDHYPIKQSKSPLRHSPNGKNKRLLTKDIMSGIFF